MLFLCILGFNNVVGWQRKNRELFSLTSCGSGWGCCFSWLQSFSGFGGKWCCWKPCPSPHYERHGNAHAHGACWPHSLPRPEYLCRCHSQEYKKIQELNVSTQRLEARMGNQEESEMPGKGTKSGDWMILRGGQAGAQVIEQKCPSSQGHSIKLET